MSHSEKKALQNRPKIVLYLLIFLCVCILFVDALLKIVSRYDECSVLVSDGFPNTVWIGGGGGGGGWVNGGKPYPVFVWIF